MFEDDSEDIPIRLTPWDVFAIVTNLVLDVTISFAKFFSAITHMLTNQADVVDAQKAFHDDVVRTIETITEGE